MTRLLYINASPRSESASHHAAQIFLDALKNDVVTQRIDLFKIQLPEITNTITNAKFKFVAGASLNQEEKQQWDSVMNMVEELKAADYYLMAVPMWNFSIPYKLKHYIDLVNHPGLTFTRDETGPRGLANGSATVIFSRGGDYSPKDDQPDPFDFQSVYLKTWLGSIGISPVTEILIQNTILGSDTLKAALESVTEKLQGLAKDL